MSGIVELKTGKGFRGAVDRSANGFMISVVVDRLSDLQLVMAQQLFETLFIQAANIVINEKPNGFQDAKPDKQPLSAPAAQPLVDPPSKSGSETDE